jgi:hypothetical protein
LGNGQIGCVRAAESLLRMREIAFAMVASMDEANMKTPAWTPSFNASLQTAATTAATGTN